MALHLRGAVWLALAAAAAGEQRSFTFGVLAAANAGTPRSSSDHPDFIIKGQRLWVEQVARRWPDGIPLGTTGDSVQVKLEVHPNTVTENRPCWDIDKMIQMDNEWVQTVGVQAIFLKDCWIDNFGATVTNNSITGWVPMDHLMYTARFNRIRYANFMRLNVTVFMVDEFNSELRGYKPTGAWSVDVDRTTKGKALVNRVALSFERIVGYAPKIAFLWLNKDGWYADRVSERLKLLGDLQQGGAVVYQRMLYPFEQACRLPIWDIPCRAGLLGGVVDGCCNNGTIRAALEDIRSTGANVLILYLWAESYVVSGLLKEMNLNFDVVYSINNIDLTEQSKVGIDFAVTSGIWSAESRAADPLFGSNPRMVSLWKELYATDIPMADWTAREITVGPILTQAISKSASLAAVFDYGSLNRIIEDNVLTESFFGPIRYRSFRYNNGFETLELQVQGRERHVVLPDNMAAAPFALPMPTWECRGGGCVCPEGMQRRSDNLKCVECAPGYYKATRSSGGCLPCGPGFKSGPAASRCTQCAGGEFNSLPGRSECQQCQPGYFRPANSTDAQFCQPCGSSSFSAEPGSEACSPCPGPLVTASVGAQSREACICPGGMYCPSDTCWESGACVACPGGMSCAQGSTLTSYDHVSNVSMGGGAAARLFPRLLPGHTSSAEQPLDVFKCPVETHCPGGVPGRCQHGHQGRTCTSCPVGMKDVDGRCARCAGWEVVVLIILSIISLCALAGILAGASVKPSIQNPLVVSCFMCIGQMFTFVQVLSAFSTTSLAWGSPFDHLLGVLAVFSLDVEVLRLECAMVRKDVATYAFKMALPILATGLMMGLFLCARVICRKPMPVNGLVSAIGQVMVLFLLSLTLSILTPFKCFRHPNGATSVVQHPEVLCWQRGGHSVMVGVAIASILAYPVGILSATGAAVYKYPRAIVSDNITFMWCFRSLFFRWRPECYWFGLATISRSLFLAFLPMLVPDQDVEMTKLLMFACLLAYLVLTLKHEPWRTSEMNFLDAALASASVCVLQAGASHGTGERYTQASSTLLFTLCVAATAACLALAAARIAQHVLFSRSAGRFKVFLSHHKGGGACAARYLKLALGSLVRGRIFYDCDDLRSLERLLDAVRLSDSVLVIMSGQTLCRPWCIGEIVTATTSKISIRSCVLAAMDGGLDLWQHLSEAQFADLFGKFEVLRPHGIALEDIRPAVDKLLSTVPIFIPLKDTARLEAALEETVDSLLPSASFMAAPLAWSVPAFPPVAATSSMNSMSIMSFAPLLVISDPGDMEAAASARVVKLMLQERLQQRVELDLNLEAMDFADYLRGESVATTLCLFTSMALESAQLLARLTLFYTMRPKGLVHPLIIGESFFYPGQAYYEKLCSGGKWGSPEAAQAALSAATGARLELDAIVNSVQRAFTSIAVTVNVPQATKAVLDAQVKTLAESIGAHRKQDSGQRAEPEWLTKEMN